MACPSGWSFCCFLQLPDFLHFCSRLEPVPGVGDGLGGEVVAADDGFGFGGAVTRNRGDVGDGETGGAVQQGYASAANIVEGDAGDAEALHLLAPIRPEAASLAGGNGCSLQIRRTTGKGPGADRQVCECQSAKLTLIYTDCGNVLGPQRTSVSFSNAVPQLCVAATQQSSLITDGSTPFSG